jgi:hypothetical protein
LQTGNIGFVETVEDEKARKHYSKIHLNCGLHRQGEVWAGFIQKRRGRTDRLLVWNSWNSWISSTVSSMTLLQGVA